MSLLSRIHRGVMGNAQCHATAGWFCVATVVNAIEVIKTFRVKMMAAVRFRVSL